MRPILRASLFACCAVAAGLSSRTARADPTTVVVLGVRSVEGDDDFARTITDSLRHEARQVPGFRVLEHDVSLAQMVLALGCDDVDPRCLSQIAAELHAQRVIYGSMRRTTATERYSFAVEFFAFDAEAGEIKTTVADSIPRALADVDNIRQKVRAWVAILAGVPSVGGLRVRSNVDAPEILLNGESVGRGAGGMFVSDRVPAGGYLLEVMADGYETFRQRIAVGVGTEVEIAADLVRDAPDVSVAADEATSAAPPVSGGGLPTEFFAGAGIATVGLGLIVGGAYSVAKVDSINGDPDLLAYRMRVPSGLDACSEASGSPPNDYGYTAVVGGERFQRVRALCSDGSSFEVLQVVFLGIGAAAAVAGAYLMFTHLEAAPARPARPEARVRIVPRLGLSEASLLLRIEM